MLASFERLGKARWPLAVFAVLALVLGGWFAWWTLSPLFLSRTVSESVTSSLAENTPVSEADLTVLSESTFSGADAFHQVSGAASVIDRGADRILRLGEDFRSTNGPDLFVWLVRGEDYQNGVLDLGRLKGNVGAQNYVLPEGTDLSQYDRVVIWCRAFGVLFGSASLG